jgi:hypothetical protein
MNDHILDAESLPRYSEKVSSENDSFSMKSLEKAYSESASIHQRKQGRSSEIAGNRDCYLIPQTGRISFEINVN